MTKYKLLAYRELFPLQTEINKYCESDEWSLIDIKVFLEKGIIVFLAILEYMKVEE